MSPIVPGIDGFPMSAATKLRGRDLCMVERMVSNLAEPRRINPCATHSNPNIRVSHVALNFGHLFGVQHRSAIQVTSSPLTLYQVMIPLRGRLIGHTDIEATPGTALIYSPQDRLNTYWSEDCIALVLSVYSEKLSALARATFPALEPNGMRIGSLMALTDGSGRSFINALSTICRESMDPNSAFNRGITTKSVEETLLLSLLLAQKRDAQTLSDTTICSNRRNYVARALDYIDAHLTDELTLTDLIHASGVSARTLQYGFIEQFGVGPITYLKRLRMRCVHDALRKAPPGSCMVGNVAAQWGFFNGSTFARTYRQMFGELPSETLSQREHQ